MEFIAFELFIGGEAGAMYAFTTTCQTSNPRACKNAHSLMLQEA
jgi:hypothetical protein